METIVKGLKQSQGDNEPELFVYMKQGEKTEKESTQLLHTQQQSQKQIPKYTFHSSIEKSLGDVKALGEFEEAASLKPLSLKLRGEYKVKTTSDKSICDIAGACYLQDASIMITDWENKSLKQLDSSYKVTRSLDMGTYPHDVCYTTNNEVAVTLYSKMTVQFVSVGASLKKTRIFSVGNYCRGITCSNRELFVCCEGLDSTDHVKVFSLTGKSLRTIKCDPQGQPLFSDTQRVTISSCGNRLYVTDREKGVITTDRSGNLQHRFQDNDLSKAIGICTLDNGDILVCGYDSHNVLHMSRDGRKLARVLGQQDGLINPKALAFYPICSRLIVTTEDCNTIKVYDVK